MYLESTETTEKVIELKRLGLNVLTTKLPGSLSGWEVIGFDVEPAATITKYPLILQLTLAHDEYTDLGELEELIEDREAIVDWMKRLGISFEEVEFDINSDRYDDDGDIPSTDDFTPPDYQEGDEV